MKHRGQVMKGKRGPRESKKKKKEMEELRGCGGGRSLVEDS